MVHSLGQKNINQVQKLGEKKNNNNSSIGGKFTDTANEIDLFNRDVAQEAYDPVEKRDPIINGYNYDKNLSDANTAVYYNPTSHKSQIGMRGSVTKSDWASNIGAIGPGLETIGADFRKDRQTYDNIKKKYGKDTIINSSGHSRGGRRSSNLAYWKGGKSQTYNSATTPFSVGQKLTNIRCKNPIKALRPAYCGNVKHNRIAYDPVSYFGKKDYGSHSEFKQNKKGLDSHSMMNFF